MKKRIVRLFTMAGVMMLLVALMAMPAYAAGGNVSGAIEGTWSAAQGQIKDIVGAFAGQILSLAFDPNAAVQVGLKLIFFLLAFAYCVIKVFFANIKRGGILLVQTAVGSLYLFSVPRGYTDGFYQWCKQVIAICLTAFMQTTLLFLGMMTFQNNMLLGLGIMLAAGEVPRIAQQFGLDSSVRVNMSSVIYSTSSAVNLTRNPMKAKPA